MQSHEVTGSQLIELMCLMSRIQDEIKLFSHVSGHIPNSLIEEINNFQRDIQQEYSNRQS